jgi:hypothetical protein
MVKQCVDCGKEITQISIRCKSCSNTFRTGKYHSNGESKLEDKNPMWKGNEVKYGALHDWVKSHKPKSMFCEKCGKVTNKLDCANISGEYKRDISDYRWICRHCHMEEDGRSEASNRARK